LGPKAPGLDGLKGRVLKRQYVKKEQTNPSTKLFRFLLDLQIYQIHYHLYDPFLKKVRAKNLEDFGPVALTSVLTKCMERVVSYHLKPYISDQLDVLQFAYKSQRV